MATYGALPYGQMMQLLQGTVGQIPGSMAEATGGNHLPPDVYKVGQMAMQAQQGEGPMAVAGPGMQIAAGALPNDRARQQVFGRKLPTELVAQGGASIARAAAGMGRQMSARRAQKSQQAHSEKLMSRKEQLALDAEARREQRILDAEQRKLEQAEIVRQRKLTAYGQALEADPNTEWAAKELAELGAAPEGYEAAPDKADLTSDIKNFEYYKANGGELDFNEWRLQSKEAGATKINIGGEGKVGEVGKTEQSRIGQEYREALAQIREVNNIQNLDYNKYLTYKARIRKNIITTKEKAGRSITKEDRDFLKGYKQLHNNTMQLFNEYRKRITGAAAAVQELQMLQDSMIGMDLSATEFEAGLQQLDRILMDGLREKAGMLGTGQYPAPPDDGNKRIKWDDMQ